MIHSRLIPIVLVCLALSSRVAAQTLQPPSAEALRWPYVAMLAGQGADVITTYAALRNPALKEGNRLGLSYTMAGKLGTTILAAYLMRRYEGQQQPKMIKMIGVAVGLAGAVGTISIVWNVQHLQKGSPR
jgi:hypothetical protein